MGSEPKTHKSTISPFDAGYPAEKLVGNLFWPAYVLLTQHHSYEC